MSPVHPIESCDDEQSGERSRRQELPEGEAHERRTVRYVTLPDISEGAVMGSMAMHVFALAVG
ncbi:hypothetical protein [Streptomyces sennicomposti]